jgi:hypothetical protein
MLHVTIPVHHACPFCMSTVHANSAKPCCMPMLHPCVHATYPWCMSMLHVHAACPRCMSKLYDMLHVHGDAQSKVQYLQWLLRRYFTHVPVSETTVHNNFAFSSASTNAVIGFAVALEAVHHTCTGIWDDGT